MTWRIERIDEVIKKEVGEILLKEFEFENVLVTVTNVEALSDLRYAKIKISVFPEKETRKILNILEKSSFKIQKILNKKLKMKPVPKIKFMVDKSIIATSKIEALLKEAQK